MIKEKAHGGRKTRRPRPALMWGALFASLSVAAVFAAESLDTGQDVVASAGFATMQAKAADQGLRARIVAGYGKPPIRFEPNVGQSSGTVKYLARGDGYSLGLTERGAMISLTSGGAAGRLETQATPRSKGNQVPIKSALLRISLAHSQKHPKLCPEQRQDSVSNYLIGSDPSKWRSKIANYGAVRYEQVYPGIDWVVYGNPQQLEYDFVVAPKADPRKIKLRIGGVDNLKLDGNGDLLVKIGGQTIRQLKPVVYQIASSGNRQRVDGRYVLNGQQVSFAVGDYDHENQLVIDPVLEYSTYLGGSGDDAVEAIAVDRTGALYVVGGAFPGASPLQSPIESQGASTSHVSVVKLSATGAIQYSTYIGGNGTDQARAIAVDSTGNAYVAGYTSSTDFPTADALQNTYSGGDDAFVTKLNDAGNTLLFSTYLGGSDYDRVNGIAVDNSGDVYVAGTTKSTNFPTVNPLQSVYGGGDEDVSSGDAFVAKINSTGSALLYSTYLGGSGDEAGNAIAIDGVGNAYVAGFTESPNFPTSSPLKSNLSGGKDGFVAKLNATATVLLYSTYLGGSDSDFVDAIAVDEAGDAYVAGGTTSKDFPIASPLQASFAGGDYAGDAFVSKLNAAGNALVYSTYLGGGNNEFAASLALDGAGNAYIAGGTESSDFPTANPIQDSNAGSYYDAFISEINASGSSLVFSTYLGGSDDEGANAIAIDNGGDIYVAGFTSSTNFPTVNPVQSAYGGGYDDAFIVKLSVPPAVPTDLAAVAGNAQINLTWSAVNGATSYSIFQGAAASAEASAPVQTGITGSSVDVTGLDNGTTYYFIVEAVNAAGNSGASNEVSATPIAGTVATPTISPVAGAYNSVQSITISDSTPGATIYYTLDGGAPTINSTKYTAPIKVTSTRTVRAIAAADGYLNSAIASASYTISSGSSTNAQPAGGSGGAFAPQLFVLFAGFAALRRRFPAWFIRRSMVTYKQAAHPGGDRASAARPCNASRYRLGEGGMKQAKRWASVVALWMAVIELLVGIWMPAGADTVKQTALYSFADFGRLSGGRIKKLLHKSTAIIAIGILFSPATSLAGITVARLHPFQGSDGLVQSNSQALIQGSDGKLYGTTQSGGNSSSNDGGTAFNVTSGGVFTSLHLFSGLDGVDIVSGLAEGNDGNYYGVATYGGAFGAGTIFRITPDGMFSVVYAFQGGVDGAEPRSITAGRDGYLYGTTAEGGSYQTCLRPSASFAGCGTAFKVSLDGAITVLYSASNGGAYITNLVQAADGNLYGATSQSGGGICSGCDTVFKIDSGSGFSLLYSSDGAGGLEPAYLTIGADGSAYGWALNLNSDGSEYTGGTLFKIESGSFQAIKYLEGVSIYQQQLTVGNDGNFYVYGVDANVFTTLLKISPAGALTDFGPLSVGAVMQGSDGSFYGLLQDSGGDYSGNSSCAAYLYGTTPGAPTTANCGEIIKVTLSEGGTPSAPIGLTGQTQGSYVSLSWTVVPGGASYNYCQGTNVNALSCMPADGGDLYPGKQPWGVNAQSIKGLTPGQVYYFAVTATNDIGTSAQSNLVSVTPVAQVQLSGASGNGKVILTWPPAAGAATYTVQYLPASGGDMVTVASGVTATTYTVSGLTNGTSYYFYVNGSNSSGNGDSGRVSATPAPGVGAPSFNPPAGTYAGAQKVAITDENFSATIYYTTDGSTPTTSSAVYTGPITVSTSQTINAIATASGYSASDVATAAYTIAISISATPTFNPSGGSYSSVQTVTISDGTPGATIYYTTDGSTPSTGSTPYTGPIMVLTSETLSAIAVATGYTNSAVGTASYLITLPPPIVATPSFSPSAGTYSAPLAVTISDTTSGATIYYTTDGSTPTPASAVYTGPISLSTSTTIEAIAFVSGYTNSAVASAAYTITQGGTSGGTTGGTTGGSTGGGSTGGTSGGSTTGGSTGNGTTTGSAGGSSSSGGGGAVSPGLLIFACAAVGLRYRARKRLRSYP